MNPRGAIQLSFTIWLLQRWKRIKIFKNCTLKKVFGTSGLVNLVKLVFRVRASIYWYTPVVITEPAVPSARLLSLGSKVFPSKMQRMLNKDLARFIQALLSQQGQMLWRGEGGGLPYEKDGDARRLSLSVNCRFWFQLWCLWWKVTIFAHLGIV